MSVANSDLKKKLLTSRLSQDTVEVEGVGTVTVRGLSRADVLDLRKRVDEEKIDFEHGLVQAGMVDPAMSVEDVAAWQKASPAGELEAVTKKISELSGLTKEADKTAYKSV